MNTPSKALVGEDTGIFEEVEAVATALFYHDESYGGEGMSWDALKIERADDAEEYFGRARCALVTLQSRGWKKGDG